MSKPSAPDICSFNSAEPSEFLRWPYAPALNPVVFLRAYAKLRELANLCCRTVGKFQALIRDRFRAMYHRPHVIAACRKQRLPT